MPATKGGPVPRPGRKTDVMVVYGTAQAVKGWQDLLATQRNALCGAWDFLVEDPGRRTAKNAPLRGDLATVAHLGETHEQWQYELTGGARIWYYIDLDRRRVVLVQCHTHHPNATK